MASSPAFAIIKLLQAIINTFVSDYPKDSFFAFRGLMVWVFFVKIKKEFILLYSIFNCFCNLTYFDHWMISVMPYELFVHFVLIFTL